MAWKYTLIKSWFAAIESKFLRQPVPAFVNCNGAGEVTKMSFVTWSLNTGVEVTHGAALTSPHNLFSPCYQNIATGTQYTHQV